MPGPPGAWHDAGVELWVQVLSGLAVIDGDRALDLGGPKQRSVLAALALAPNRPIAPDRLISWVWGDDPPPRAETSLQAYISNLRRVLEPARKPREPATVLVTVPAGYALRVGWAQVDHTTFAVLADAGHRRLDDDPRAAASTLDRALALWLGPPLPELAEEAVGAQRGGPAARDPRPGARGPVRGRTRARRAPAARAPDRGRDRRRSRSVSGCGVSSRSPCTAPVASARRCSSLQAGEDPAGRGGRDRARPRPPPPRVRDPRPVAQRSTRRPSDALARRRHRPTPVRPPTHGRRPPAAATSALDDGGAADAAEGRRTRRGEGIFVGRERALAALRDAYDAAAAGVGRPVIVRGEPGVGKTRLVEELAAQVPGVVVWGRCPESAGSATYWPCIQIGRQLEGAGAIDGDLLGALLPDGDVSTSPAGDRLSLHISIARLLTTANQPVVIVVDDLHWADTASQRVLEFVASELRDAPLLLVVTTRPVTADSAPALVDCVGELARQPGVVNLELEGLTRDDVEAWLEVRTQGRPDPRAAELVHDRTGGNPFFVNEVVEMLAGEGGLDGALSRGRLARVPAGVQDVIRRRVGRLPAATQQLLVVASVVGRTFDVDLLATVADEPVIDVLDAIDPALDADLVAETDLPGRFQFAHALVADTLLAEVSATRRARLHARTVGALERLRAADLDAFAAELAHHAFEGAAAGTGEAAVGWAERAARSAMSRLAFEDAAASWDLAIRALEVARPADRTARLDALIERARAWMAGDNVVDAFASLVEAIDLAIAVGDLRRLGDAIAAANVEGLWFAGEIGEASLGIGAAIERALTVLSEDMTAARALGLSAIADYSYFWRPVDELDALTAEAVALARRSGDDTVLARALLKRNQALYRPSTFDARAEASDELRALAEADRLDGVVEAEALFVAASVHWDRVELLPALDLVERAQRLAERSGSAALISQLGLFRGSILTTLGRLAEAIAQIEAAAELYRRTRRLSAETFRLSFLAMPAFELDDHQPVVDLVELAAESALQPWLMECAAFGFVEMGDPDRARALIGNRLPPPDDSWLLLGATVAGAHVRVAAGRRRCGNRAPPPAGAVRRTPRGVGHRRRLRRRRPRRRSHPPPPRPRCRGPRSSPIVPSATSSAPVPALGWRARSCSEPSSPATRATTPGPPTSSTGSTCRCSASASDGPAARSKSAPSRSEPAGVTVSVSETCSGSNPGASMTPATPDLTGYHAIHHAVRRAPHRLAAAARDLTPGDTKRVKAIVRYWNGYRGELDEHHRIEDDIFFPALVERVPVAAELIARTATEHAELDDLLEDGQRAVAHLRSGRADDGEEAATAFDAVAAHLDAHLDFEDAEILPLFARHLSRDEYDALYTTASKGVGFRQALFTVPFLGLAASDEARAQLLADAPAALTVVYRLTRGHHLRLESAVFGSADPAPLGSESVAPARPTSLA